MIIFSAWTPCCRSKKIGLIMKSDLDRNGVYNQMQWPGCIFLELEVGPDVGSPVLEWEPRFGFYDHLRSWNHQLLSFLVARVGQVWLGKLQQPTRQSRSHFQLRLFQSVGSPVLHLWPFVFFVDNLRLAQRFQLCSLARRLFQMYR